MLISNRCPICESAKLVKTPALVMPFISYRIFGWKPLEISDESGMRSLQNSTSYQLCATTYCEECTLIFCDVRFDDNEMGKLYKDYREQQYVIQRQMFEPDYGRTNDYLMQTIHYLKSVTEYLESHTENVWTNGRNFSWIKLNLGSRVTFTRCTTREYEELVKTIGSIDKEFEDTYRLKIFVTETSASQIAG